MKNKQLFFAMSILFMLIFLSLAYAQDNSTPAANEVEDNNPEVTDAPVAADTSSSSTTTPVAASSTDSDISPSTPENESNIIDEENDNNNNEENKTQEFNVNPGMTPDNPVYFVKDTYQRITVGNNPEKALDYREQKIAEAKAMVEKGKPEGAKKVLDRAMEYGNIVEREVNPNLQKDINERSKKVQNVIEDLKGQVDDKDIQYKFDENLEKEKKIETASELVAKINELCEALSQLDPLQYSDTCKPKTNSPKWMIEKDKELTNEQSEEAKIFIEKLSACFEAPEKCDCKGMGVQKFEDFCLEKSKLGLECKNGNEKACKEFENSADPTELLPDYLIPSFKQVETKYMKSEFDMHMPSECTEAKAKTPEECNKIMFKLDSPKECIDAGLTGKSSEDEIKCKKIIYEKNSPKECLDAGIDPTDKNAPRKCAKIMFQLRVPQECLDAGLTGESRDDQKKCDEITKNTGKSSSYAPKFNRDCNTIKEALEKVKCYEEFYNNAQVQFKDDFVKDVIDQNTGEKITPEEENERKACRDKGMDTILEHDNGKRIIICVDKNYNGDRGGEQGCQSQQQIENLRQDCKNRGQDSTVETRGGCPWVICISTSGSTGGQGYKTPSNNVVNTQPAQSGGQKCPDGICDDYEKMNPYACPEDCGGTRQPGNYVQQQPGNQQPPQNRIDQPTQPEQNQQNFCQGSAPSCAPNGAPYCQNGNWVCPQATQQQPQAPQQEQEQPTTVQEQPVQQQPQAPQQEQQQPTTVQEQPQQPAPQEQPAPAPATDTAGGSSGEIESSPLTGGVISIDQDNSFLDYWWN